MTDNYIDSYVLHHGYNYNQRVEILTNLSLLSNIAKIKLHLKYLAYGKLNKVV